MKGASGVIGGGLLTASMVMAIAIEPGSSITGDKLLEHYADDRVVIIASWAILQMAGVALLWFLGGVRTRLAQAHQVGVERHAASAVLGGTVLVALAYISRATAAAMPAFTNFRLRDGFSIPTLPSCCRIASYEILAGAGVAGRVLVAAAAVGGRRAGLLGPWLARVGYGVAVVALVSSAFAYLPVAATRVFW